MSNMNFKCDVCGREVQGCTFINGMKFCAKCYQETFGNKNMTENLNNMYEAYLKILNEKDKQITDLQSQLAEKDKEIEELKLDNKKYFTDSCRANKEIAYKLKQQNQKAIEELEKLFYETDNIYHTNEMDKMWLLDYLKSRIFELKGETK